MEFNMVEFTRSGSDALADIECPLVIDLDETFINTDLLHEAFIALLKKNPLYIFPSLLWLIKGKVCFKKKIFELVDLQYDLLPYNKELLAFLDTESAKGRKLVLATASLQSAALKIADVHPVFDGVFGTEDVNLKGKDKAALLTKQFGEGKFDYIGNALSDLKIFASSRYSYLVNPSSYLERQTKKISELKYSWRSKKAGWKDYIKAIRVYQWIKNLLLFVPIITSHSFSSVNLIGTTFAGFIAFSLAASAGYVINDLLDLNADRQHPRKCFRPFASGKIPVRSGALMAFTLLSASIAIAAMLNGPFLLILLAYVAISFSYSMLFKKMVMYDVFVLAVLYSTRIIAGGLVTGIAISFWLIAFSTFIFLSLAFVKRYSELMKINTETGLKHRGREYESGDLNLLQVMGIVSGFLSVVVFSLYLDSNEVTHLYTHPKILWATSFLFLFWISRIWIITNRGEMTDDPIVFAIRDATSYCIFLIIGLILFIAA